MLTLGMQVTEFTEKCGKPVVLMIDGVDKSNNQLFLSFLGMLRDKYIEPGSSGEATFHSVILAGVYDIRNIKLKLRLTSRRRTTVHGTSRWRSTLT